MKNFRLSFVRGGGGQSLKPSHNRVFGLFEVLKSLSFYGGVFGRFFATAQNDLGRHSELDSESINVGYNNLGNKFSVTREPSPEFLSSLQLTKKFNPLTEREGNNIPDKVFSRFPFHFSLFNT